MAKKSLPQRSKEATDLARHITQFVNAAFGRKLGRLGPSRNLVDAVQEALDYGYSDIEVRMAFWSARCIPNSWIGAALAGTTQPELVLRHKGGMNTITGKPAKRWLDDLTDSVGEINPRLAAAILRTLPEEMQQGERELLQHAGIGVD
jgi:hypothetical protein